MFLGINKRGILEHGNIRRLYPIQILTRGAGRIYFIHFKRVLQVGNFCWEPLSTLQLKLDGTPKEPWHIDFGTLLAPLLELSMC